MRKPSKTESDLMTDIENNIPYTNRISDMEINERPRERLIQVGAKAISNSELLAILLRIGVSGVNVIDLANGILNKYGGLRGIKKASYEELSAEKGVGPAKAAQILAAVELGRRLASLVDENDRITIHTSTDVYEMVRYEMESFDHEELWVINLDTRHRVLVTDKLYKGSLNSSPIRIAEIFRKPVSRNAAAIILVHNHPSGDPKPSAADIAVTRSILDAGKLMEIPMLDHLIIGHGKFESILSFCN